ncbi:MAG: hypothetical protein ACJAZN_002391 [Planctomycetota bacterium]|jgi:hypothetical protein
MMPVQLPSRPPTRQSGWTSLSRPVIGWLLAGIPAAVLLSGCRGDRILRIESIPPGATVRLDDHVIGRTPLEIDFEHYGQRRLALYKATYRTYSEPLELLAPWWARFPIDLLTEVILPLGLDDVREKVIVLTVDAGETEATVATQEFIEHAVRARSGDKLEGVPLAGDTPDSGPDSGPDGDVNGASKQP